MKATGFELIMGEFLARSVRGISCAPPAKDTDAMRAFPLSS